MTSTQRKTLKLRQKIVKDDPPPDEKSVASRTPDVGKTLDHHNAQMVSEQRRRVNHPHDDGS